MRFADARRPRRRLPTCSIRICVNVLHSRQVTLTNASLSSVGVGLSDSRSSYSSPVYFGSATALIKSLMERAGYISRLNGEPFTRKVGGPLVVARRAGHNFTMAQLTFWFQILGMVVPGSTYWNIAFGREKGEVENSIIMDDCHIEITGRITDSLVGAGSVLTTNQKSPKGYRLVVGENSRIIL